MKKLLLLLMLLSVGINLARAGSPTGRNTNVVAAFDRSYVPSSISIWSRETTGFDTKDPLKWGNNTLTCLSRTDPTYGACMTAPIILSNQALSHGYVTLRFTHESTHKTVDLQIYAKKNMSIYNSVYSSPSYATYSPDPMGLRNEPYFSFYIEYGELRKFNLSGFWTATLKQNLRQWINSTCGGHSGDPEIGCPDFPTIAHWEASIRIEVLDFGNQQIYLPAFPYSSPVVNLNLNNNISRNMINGKNTLDMCLFDGNNSRSSRTSLRFEDDDGTVPGRTAGAFSVRRRGGNLTNERDRLDYNIILNNPITGTRENVSNGKEIIWQGTNDQKFLRKIILPNGYDTVFCVPAPITFLTPAFEADSKNAGDYTGTLRVIYTPSTL